MHKIWIDSILIFNLSQGFLMAVFKERGILSAEFLYYLVDLYNENNDNFVKQGSILDQFKNPPQLWGALKAVGVLYSFSSQGEPKAQTHSGYIGSNILLIVRSSNMAIEIRFENRWNSTFPKALDLKFYASQINKIYIQTCRYRVLTTDALAEEDVLHLEMVR